MMTGKTIIVFLVLTMCNFMIFMYNMMPEKSIKSVFTCSLQHHIDTLSRFVSFNGEKSMKEHMPEVCIAHAPSVQRVDVFRQAFKDVAYKCSQQRPMILDMEVKKPILTLFTSFEPTESKYEVYNTTVQNWSTFLPKVNLILFTNDTRTRTFCESRGWKVFPITHHAAGGVPILKRMFIKAQETFDTPFYGFSNADILFTDKLLETLVVTLKDFGGNTKVMITGRRFNIPKLTPKEVVSYENIRSAVTRRGELFVISSEDFFITSKTFDWTNIPDVVVGRPAYDNWLIAHARCTGNIVIDATNTVLCAHQTTSSGNMEGWNNKYTNYNQNLLERLKVKQDYSKGYIVCPEIKTVFNLCGNIQTVKKPNVPDYCKC